MQRVPKPNRWDADLLSNLIATTSKWVIDDEIEAEVVMLPPGGSSAVVEPQVEQEYIPRHVYLYDKDFDQWGYTSSCRRCTYMRQGRSTKGMSHTRQCRERIEERLAEAGGPRVLAAKERFEKEMAKELEKDDDRAQGPQSEEAVLDPPVPFPEPAASATPMVPAPSTPDLRLPVDADGMILGPRDDDGW